MDSATAVRWPVTVRVERERERERERAYLCLVTVQGKVFYTELKQLSGCSVNEKKLLNLPPLHPFSCKAKSYYPFFTSATGLQIHLDY